MLCSPPDLGNPTMSVFYQYLENPIGEQMPIKFVTYFVFMPIISVSLFSGRNQREKDRLAEAITETTCKILGVDKKEVIIIFREELHGNWYSEGVRI